MITTNRFDFSISDHDKYYSLLKRVINKYPTLISWVANNPFESKYASLKLGPNYLNFTMIRPFGLSSLPKYPKISLKEASLPVIVNYPNTRPFQSVLEKSNLEFKLLGKKYGGPTALTQHKALISVPYQVSTMKMYENLANGVVTYVPTPRYLIEFLENDMYELSAVNATRKVGQDWYTYVEPYNPQLSEFFYQFDSLDELKELLKGDVDPRNVKTSAPLFWKEMRRKSERQWRLVFDELFTRFYYPEEFFPAPSEIN